MPSLRPCWVPVLAILLAAAAAGADFHLDCGGGSDTASGRTPAEAWNSLKRANDEPLQPGDRLLLRRGSRCGGFLAPQGSGHPGRPITAGAYGEGPLPAIEAAGHDTAVLLWNQSHWRIRDLEVSGSSVHGIFVGGKSGAIRDIEIRDVFVHGVHGALKTKNSGLIVVHATGDAALEDIVIDGALAEKTTQWAGILVNGSGASDQPLRSRNVAVRNSIARDVWGDGIILFQVKDGVIERSAAWKTGMQPRQSIGTPNGIWTWRCENCVVRECESYWSDSPGVDGGAFDIDWGNVNNTVERSYGHDTLSYCIAVFGAANLTTANSLIRGNVCAGLGRSPRLARNHGAIHLYTWNGGLLDGVRIEDNVIEWDAAIRTPAIRDDAQWAGAARAVIEGNTVREGGARNAPDKGGRLRFRLGSDAASRGLRVVMESAKAQYGARGLEVTETDGPPCVEYFDAGGRLLRKWEGYAPAAEVLWLVRQRLGPPSEW